MGIPFQAGLQFVLDAQMEYNQAGLECFLRVSNFAPSGAFIEVGVPYVPTGTAAANTGFVDILIQPTPMVRGLPSHDKGYPGIKLMFGAREFLISDTFVRAVLQQYPAIPYSYDVFREWDHQTASVIGLAYNRQLFSIEDISHIEVAGRVIQWKLICNAHELPLVGSTIETLWP